MRCCPACFGDRGLERNLIPLTGRVRDTCPTCLTPDVLVIDAKDLRQYFVPLADAYQESKEGQLLVHWFRQDWALFEHPRMEDARAKELLTEILDDGEIVRRNHVPLTDGTDRIYEWEALRSELMYRNRYFPESSMDLDTLQKLFSSLTLEPDEFPSKWFRARLESDGKDLTAADMGAPPNRKASHGRANPAGIPYLYLGSKSSTAVAEVRPQTGEIAYVGEFTTSSELRLVDLQRPRKTISPFLEEDIVRMRSALPFLERLGEELTRPVLPQSAAVDYTPSQFLCEFIKHCGYDGVLYRSSVSEGVNLALFQPTDATCNVVKKYEVQKVNVTMTEVSMHIL